MRNIIASLIFAMFGVAAYADDNGSLIVVELYTSEGCSSCPAADKILTKLAAREGILALALHVDYWDYLGWKDEFSMAKFTDRQEYYNMALGSRYRLVTPQMIFHGQSYVAGAKMKRIEQRIAALRGQSDKVVLQVEKQNDKFNISINPLDVSVNGADVFIVEYMPTHVTEVEAGENRGKILNHTNIVTSWERVGEWSGQNNWQVEHAVTGGSMAAVIVQAADNGPILAARKLQ
jgi:hypothetical protein